MRAGVALMAAAALVVGPAPPGPVWSQGPRVALVAPDAAPPGEDSLPVPATTVTEAMLAAPHHDYPASDLMVPPGTPVFAARPGRAVTHSGARCGLGVSVVGRDRRRYVYCHLSVVAVGDGTEVGAGDVLGLSGDTGNAKGVPHLHFHVLDRAGGYLCPQPLLLSWYEGRRPPLAAWGVTDGCSFPR